MHSAPSIQNTTAADLMSRTVFTLDAEMPVSEAFSGLGDDHIGGAPVLDTAGRVIGMFSMQDVAQNADEAGMLLAAERLRAVGAEDDFAADDSRLAALGAARVRDWMSTDVAFVAPGASLQAVCQAFTEHGVHRLVVLDEGSLIGIVSTTDVVRHIAG